MSGFSEVMLPQLAEVMLSQLAEVMLSQQAGVMQWHNPNHALSNIYKENIILILHFT